jgi:sec-independent protein translocase protein TatB
MLSIPHLVIIFLIALIVLGPEKLPQIARVMGKAMADFRRITTDFRVQIEDEMREMERHTRVQQMAPAEASPYHPTDPELLGAVPAASATDAPTSLTPAPLTPAEVSPPPPGFTGAPEPASPAAERPATPSAAPVTSETATVPEKPADGEHHSA